MKSLIVPLIGSISAILAVDAIGLEDFKISGSVAAVAASADEAFYDERNVIGLNGRWELETRLDQVTAFARFEALSDRNLGENRYPAVMREAWLRYQASAYDVTLGRQLLPVGKTDVIILQDQFAPKDLTQLSLYDADQRLGVTAARLDYFPNELWTLSAALVYQDQSYILPTLVDEQIPRWEPLSEDPDVGGLLRANLRNGRLEFATGVTLGASPLPAIEVQDTGFTISNIDESRMFLDGTYSLDSSILRWDIVWHRFDAAQALGVPEERWSTSVGWDKNLWSNSMLNLQWIYRADSERDEEHLGNQQLAPVIFANRALLQSFDSRQYWLTSTLRQQVRAEHDLELTLIAGADDQYGIVQRYVWRPFDNVSTGIRLQYLKAYPRSLLGVLTPARHVYWELRYHI